MRDRRFLAMASLAACSVIAALTACSSGVSAGGGSVKPSVTDGEEGGACLTDGTCNGGLVCESGRCVMGDDGADDEPSDGDTPNTDDPDEPDDDGDEGNGADDGPPADDPPPTRALLIFHNNLGPMCLDALAWLTEAQQAHGGLVVEEHLTTDPAEVDLLWDLQEDYSASEGVSAGFQYLPIIFFEGRAFSGFDEGVEEALSAMLVAEDETSE